MVFLNECVCEMSLLQSVGGKLNMIYSAAFAYAEKATVSCFVTAPQQLPCPFCGVEKFLSHSEMLLVKSGNHCQIVCFKACQALLLQLIQVKFS